MKIIHTARELGNGSQPVCLAIGVFDGVHLGHQQIIRQTVADARRLGAQALVVTFDRHPNAVVAPSRTPPTISTRTQKLGAVASLEVDALLEIPFDRAFSEKTGEQFIRELVQTLGHIGSICVGADFVFGHRRSGNVELLSRLGTEHGYRVHAHAAVALDGETISSTRIREAIRLGNLEAASQMLGRAYALAGKVVTGDRLGRQLGFPTANLAVGQLVLPPYGVYRTRTQVDGHWYRAALNLGVRPTMNRPQPELRAEAHLLDFSGDLYERELELVVDAKIRDEQKFGSLAELQAQIERDLQKVRAE